MSATNKLTLAEARRQGKVDQFIDDHNADAPGDESAFNRALRSMAGTSKEAPGASKPRRSDD